MDKEQGRWGALTLELVPMDDSPSPPASRTAPAAERTPDPDALREAYLQARFPGVIRELSDLGDKDRVSDAVRCYAEEGRADRAQELVMLALAELPDREARLQPQPAGTATGPTAYHHAARIHRFLVARTAAGKRAP